MSEILPDFIKHTEAGFYCSVGDFYIDPKKPVKCAVISHAHADHAIAGSYLVYSTKATFDFMLLRYKKNAAKESKVFDYHEKFQINGVILKFISAGHVLGSAQILMEYKGINYLYSGDVKAQADTTTVPIEYCKADVLITETTFANPNIKHPIAEEEIKKILTIKRPLILGCYVLGKAQRITQMIHDIDPNCVISIHRDIIPYHKIYERYQSLKANYLPTDKKDFKLNNPYCYLVPPLTYHTFKAQHKFPIVFASGWEALQEKNETSFLLSDHMDWDDLLNYVEQVNPTEIWTIHGNGKDFMEHFSNKKVKVLAN